MQHEFLSKMPQRASSRSFFSYVSLPTDDCRSFGGFLYGSPVTGHEKSPMDISIYTDQSRLGWKLSFLGTAGNMPESRNSYPVVRLDHTFLMCWRNSDALTFPRRVAQRNTTAAQHRQIVISTDETHWTRSLM
jgi:hypothetical protein